MSLYCFDIDGTLIRSFMREGDAEHDYDDIELLPGRWEMVYDLARQGDRYVAFALVTNQAGVAMGYQTFDQVWAKLGRIIVAFEGFHACPLSVHVCMDHPKAKVENWKMDPCPRRKPGPGMILEAIDAHRVLASDTVMVGDMDTDRLAAEAAEVRYVDAEDFFR